MKSIVTRGQAATAMVDIEERLERASEDRLKVLRETLLALEEGWGDVFNANVAFLAGAARARSQVRELKQQELSEAALVRQTGRLAASDVLRFSISSRFLKDCVTYLIGDEQKRERLHLVTGPVTPEGVRVMSEMLKVGFIEQSVGGVKANPVETHRIMMGLDGSGFELLATFHCHPMLGAGGTSPSGTDIANQDRFAQVGWDAVMGIASQDGYFRLFSTVKEIDVSVFGRGVAIVSREPRCVVLKVDLS